MILLRPPAEIGAADETSGGRQPWILVPQVCRLGTMPTRIVYAVSPGLPADDLRDHPAGDRAAATAAVERLFPDRTVSRDRPTEESVSVATYGPTVVLWGAAAGEGVPPEGHGSYAYHYQTTSMATSYLISTAASRREVHLGPEGVEHEVGERLPFEDEAWPTDDDPDGASDGVDRLASAAALWMFGYRVEDRDPAEWPHLFGEDFHEVWLESSSTTDPATGGAVDENPTASEPISWWQRLRNRLRG